MFKTGKTQRAVYLLGLILAGEAVFALPFHIARFFRPTVLDVFNLTATELGAAQGVYGITAVFSYFLGGPIADRFEARKLLAGSLWLTAAGGLYMATTPGYIGAMLLWGFFGASTILLFWAALIRATRDWGGTDRQGRAYGILDSGRGILAVVLATMAAGLFSVTFPSGYDAASALQKEAALRTVILAYTGVTALIGGFIWFALRAPHPDGATALSTWRPGQEGPARHVLRALRLPAVWLQAVIVLCAYVGYKGFDHYSLYVAEVYQLAPVTTAWMMTLASWCRPVAALGAGLLADRFSASRITLACFIAMLVSYLIFALTVPGAGALWLLLSNILLGAIGFFGVRGVYYAIFEEASVPGAVTGTAVGIASVIGFTPDIFVTLIAGLLVDASPGIAGHQHFFWFMAVFAAVGCAASLLTIRLTRSRAGTR